MLNISVSQASSMRFMGAAKEPLVILLTKPFWADNPSAAGFAAFICRTPSSAAHVFRIGAINLVQMPKMSASAELECWPGGIAIAGLFCLR